MRIEKVRLILIEKELKEEFITSFGPTKKRKIVLVNVKTENDVDGWGESVAGNGPWFSYETYETVWITIRDYLSKLILKKEISTPFEAIEMMTPVRGHNMAKYALEAAIFDAYGKEKKITLRDLVGGTKKEIEVGVSIGIQKTLDDLIKKIGEYLDQGYKRIKIKIKPGWDIKPIKRIRREFGDIMLQVDANAAYKENQIETFKEMDKYDLLMIEQPFHYEDFVHHSKLQKEITTPICLDESIYSPQAAETAIALESAKIINIKPGRVGGITNSKIIHDLGTKNGMGLWIGGMLETGIGRSFLVALASLPGINYPSDISGSSRYWHEDIVEPEFSVSKNGTMKVPESPGIGVDVSEDKINRIKIREITLS